MRNAYPRNNIIDVIHQGRPAIGTFNYIRDVEVIEILAEAGLDYVIIDTEHAVMSRETVEQQVMAAQLNHITPLVRVPCIDAPTMRSYLEMGVQGIMVPHIRNAEECRRAQDAMRYPPVGHASTCRSNRSTAFRGENWLDYLDWVENASLIAMIEDPEGMENLPEILDELKPGRDMVMFGKADYTQSLGLFDRSGSVDSAAVTDAGNKLMSACKERGIPLIIVPEKYSKEGIQKVADNGGTVVCIGVDQNIMLVAYENIAKDGRCITLK